MQFFNNFLKEKHIEKGFLNAVNYNINDNYLNNL